MWAAAPTTVPEVVEPRDEGQEEESGGLFHLLAVLLLVVAVALVAGALVTAFGIALTV